MAIPVIILTMFIPSEDTEIPEDVRKSYKKAKLYGLIIGAVGIYMTYFSQKIVGAFFLEYICFINILKPASYTICWLIIIISTINLVTAILIDRHRNKNIYKEQN